MSSQRLANIGVFLKRIMHSRHLAIILAIVCAFSISATYLAIFESGYLFATAPEDVLWLVLFDMILLLMLIAIIARRIVQMIVARRKGSVGSRLQTRIVVMFSMISIIPTVLMALFSTLFFHYGIQTWFDNKVNTAIDGSLNIAKSYLTEHKKNIRADVLGMANDIDRDAHNLRRDPRPFSKKLSILAGIRKLPEALVFQTIGDRKKILASSSLAFSLQLVVGDLSDDVIRRAAKGELVILTSNGDDRVIALIRLDSFFDSYLLVGRFVDNRILSYIELTSGAANEYMRLKENVSDIQIKFLAIYVIVSLLVLLAAIWLGLLFVFKIVTPISELVSATQKVRGGDLSARVKEGHYNDEIATLGRAFNSMTEQLEKQRRELVSAQRRSAWADVARRIAHEIKNPLTPIQLASDRLKKKYSSQVEDSKTFEKYLDTIIRNVSDIGNMVEEFSSFARIPAPVFSINNICEICKEMIFSRECLKNDNIYNLSLPDKNIKINCDPSQITRVLTNILKNAEESISEMQQTQKNIRGNISVEVTEKEGYCFIEIVDNGKGFAESTIQRLTEPYVTTKSKGTGLGLAIVKKIVEDHNGDLVFENVKGGAKVILSFPVAGKQ
ncbi:ATP-binding protein [Rickettsiales bacterium]|nr:ATP-binding protein [Rickettsiales bacterium]